ncbi:pri3a-like protein [Schizophyllum commune]
MRLSVILLFATLAMVGAVADTLELRDAEEQDDLVRCEFRPKRFQGYTACNQQDRAHCRLGGGNCNYNSLTRRCSNNSLMRGRNAPIACLRCSCYNRK